MPEFKLLLEDDEVEALKILAAKRRVRPQAIARDAFRAGMAGGVAQTSYTQPPKDVVTSESLKDIRDALRAVLILIDGVLCDGEPTGDELAEAQREVAEITSDRGDARKVGRDVAPHGVRQKPGRRAQ